MAMGSDDETALLDGGSMPGLEAVSDSSSECPDVVETPSFEEDWFSEVGEDASELDDIKWQSDDLHKEALIATTPVKPGQYSYRLRVS